MATDSHRRLLLGLTAYLIAEEEEAERPVKKRKVRSLWTRGWIKKRDAGYGVLHMLRSELRLFDQASFRNFCRMSESMFEELLGKILPNIKKQDTVMCESISPEFRLAVTLRFLATGNTFSDLQYSTRIPQCTLSKMIPETLEAIVEKLEKEMKFPSDKDEWESIASQFSCLWNFPHCIGALDGKHILFRPPRTSGSYYFNYKGTNSIVLLALVDAQYKFLRVSVGANGRVNDGAIFRESHLKKSLDLEKLGLPAPSLLPGGRREVPHVIVTDDAFALGKHIMKPFPFRGLSMEKRIYNYRLSRAGRVVENAFGILANRFQILLTKIRLSPEKVDLVTTACILLHNFIQNRKENPLIYEKYDFTVEDCHELRSLEVRQGGNRATEDAYEIREEFLKYFNGPGAVPWQGQNQ